MARYRVSMDIGGTFTDVVAYRRNSGTCTAGKDSATPHDPAEAAKQWHGYQGGAS